MSATVPIVDADVHIHEPDADLAPYLEMPWRRALEAGPTSQTQRNARGERIFDTPGYHPLTPYDPMLGDFPEEEPHRVISPDVLRADMDRRGVDAALVFTGRLLNAASTNDLAYAEALARSYNRYVAERWVDPARGIYAAIMAANQDPVAAAREIERYAAVEGFTAVYLPMAGNYPLWGDRSHDPIFAAAQEADLPVVLQGATTIATVFPYQLHHVQSALAKQALSQPFGALANLTNMVATGVFARFPRLRVVVNDAGVSWLPLLLDRLDHFYPHLREEAPSLAPRPTDHLRGRVSVTTHPLRGSDPAFLAACIQALGASSVLFGSDWPHFDADSPDDARALPLPDDAKRRILGANALALFRLRRAAGRVGV